MGEILNPLDAKKKYIESLTHKSKPVEEFYNDDFLKPVKLETVVRSTIIEEIDDVQRISTLEISSDSFSIEEILRLSKELKSTRETNDVPGWAKLVMASTNPNSKRKRVIDYY